MAKLSKDEIIRLYKKPHSMTVEQIHKYSGYFNSIYTIKKYIKEAKDTGEITEEDEEIFENKLKEQENKKAKKENLLESLTLKKALECKTLEEIVKEIKDETGIITNMTKISSIRKELLRRNKISIEDSEMIKRKILLRAAKRRSKTNQDKINKKQSKKQQNKEQEIER